MTNHTHNVLILGGTGAMGRHLCKKLNNENTVITVTSRQEHQSSNPYINYVKGNAKEFPFIKKILTDRRYDVIIDFMNYTTAEFKERYQTFLDATEQYIFISSARVYAESKEPLTEDSPRLLDTCKDAKYLATDEYALSKARQEDLLTHTYKKNYTIVRPSLTYDTNRLQFAISEKEEWLYRALNGRSIIFPKDMSDIKTTMTFGGDVADSIAKLVRNDKAIGETVHITGREANTWGEILKFYQYSFEKKLGNKMKIFMADDSLKIAQILNRYYQIKYARRINRTFNCEKLDSIIGKTTFMTAKEGLTRCLEDFLDGPREFKPLNVKPHAYFDKITKEHTNLQEFQEKNDKFKYIIERYTPYLYYSTTRAKIRY